MSDQLAQDAQEFTGERFVPTVKGRIEYEHVHRYGLCLSIVRGKDVLDVACGEGYGSALLAGSARSVVGVDVDPKTIDYARKRYADCLNLTLKCGDCTRLPLEDESIDVVVSFETIEHHTKHEEMLSEIRRVLRPDGILIISTPDKKIYSDIPHYHNEYHVRELYKGEFHDFLFKYFKNLRIYGQRFVTGSLIASIEANGKENDSLSSYAALTGDVKGVISRPCVFPDAVYLIGVCSNREVRLPELGASLFLSPQSDLFAESEAVIHWASSLDAAHRNLQSELALERGERKEAEGRVEREQRRADDATKRADDATKRADDATKRADDADRLIQEIYQSRSWRWTKPLRLASCLAHGRWGGAMRLLRSNLKRLSTSIALQARIPTGLTTLVSQDFDPAFYLENNPDVVASGVNPYKHYLSFGKAEGRLGKMPELDVLGNTDDFDKNRDTVIIVSHEGSRTGAPILTYNVIIELTKTYNVIAVFLKGGPLLDSCRAAGAVVVDFSPCGPANANAVMDIFAKQISNITNIKFSIINSVEARYVLQGLAKNNIPSVTLIHEFASDWIAYGSFAEAILWSNNVVFSSTLTRDDTLFCYPDLFKQDFPVFPQGRCLVPGSVSSAGESDALGIFTARDDERLKIRRVMRPDDFPRDGIVVLGVGTVCIRKGVDLFLQCAAQVLRKMPDLPVRFVWVGKDHEAVNGGGYSVYQAEQMRRASPPKNDGGYSVFLADQMRRAELTGYIHSLGEVSDLESVYEMADLLLLSSRLDPLPNVAIDAMSHGIPVLCFNKTTGIVDTLREAGVAENCVASYLDTEDMANKIISLVQSKSLRERLGLAVRDIATVKFDMASYVTRIEDLAKAAADHLAQESLDVETIVASGLVDRDFVVPRDFCLRSHKHDDLLPWIKRYVRAWAAGVQPRKPFPGFHPGIYQEQRGIKIPGADPLADYLRAGKPQGPWVFPVISSLETIRPMAPGSRIALHIHTYYTDLFPEILTCLMNNQIRPDLLISVTSEKARAEVARQLGSYSGSVIDIQVMPNRGRDIGPFLTGFGAKICAEYDIIGHLHTKKTADLKDSTVGRIWYQFLLANLLGQEASMADIILARMIDDPKIGIVFPDDPGVSGWCKDKSLIIDMAKKLGIRRLWNHFNFPIGTMFWARTSAVKSIIGLDLQWSDYPAEPVPYDGTLLHGLERLLPFAVTEAGYTIAVTNCVGISR